ncbi:MAG: glycosyltransferase [Thauera sp.]|nr:glycosyltransferase [Thauera sp.]
MTKKLDILCIIDYFLPGFLGGGPITTLVNMRKQLSEQVTLSIFTRDRDLGATTQYSGIEENQWIETPDGPIYYASPCSFGVKGLLQALANKDFDLVYLNSFFSLKASIFPFLALRKATPSLPVLLAPRGEFSIGALAIKRHKKKVFLAIVRFLNIYRDVFWHASTPMEADDIRRIFPNAAGRIFIAADPVTVESPNSELSAIKKEVGYLRIAFISRISPKKNLDGLIDILATVSLPVRLDVFGPIEDESYWRKCTELIRKLPKNIQVAAHGPVTTDLVTDTFSQHDLFAFPTHGENFGHVIFEALRAGTPVLLSDQTPWEQDDAGALCIIPVQDTQGWRVAIENAANRTNEEQERLRNAARNYASRYTQLAETKNENLELFLKVLNY